jgi:NADPH:quinone reductase-like Zn-dependent oxidoreductase
MKAWVVDGAFGVENLRCVERDVSSPGRDQVRVRVEACSLNFRDHLMVSGAYNPKQPLPLVPLSDGAGTVVEVGAEVRDLAAGDRVAGTFFRDWVAGPVPSRSVIRSTRGGPIDGMLAQEVVLEERELVKVPDHLKMVEAATLPCAALTAWSALFGHGNLCAADTVLVQGTGGVAIFALQFAKMAGAQVIATSSSDERLERAKALGADETLNYRTDPDWGKTVQAAGGVTHVLELGGSATLPQSLRAVRPGGTLFLIGNLSGAEVEFNVLQAVMQNIRLQGILVGSRAEFLRMNRAIEHRRLHPVIDGVESFDRAPEAFGSFAQGGHFGKVCIQVS